MTLWTAAITLFLVMDPVGNTPVWVSLLGDLPRRRMRWVVVREHLAALVVLLVFAFAGPGLLRLLGVDGPALPIAGGVVLFIIALRLIFPRPGGVFGDEAVGGEPMIVPLAIPLLAGPSALATVTLLASDTALGVGRLLGALGLAWLASLAILLAAPRIATLLGARGMIAVERLTGMLLTIVAVHMVMVGLQDYLKGFA
jgi:multiple antibiotic resistance protein